MVLSHDDDRTHPYWYARLIRIFHVNVEYRNHPGSRYSKPTRADVLFVRWFRRDGDFQLGFRAKRLPRIEFFDKESISDAFRFLDPDSVIRGVHLIPGFAYGSTQELLDPSFVRPEIDGTQWQWDWRYYHVNM